MFTHLLVPLDGSPLAMCVIPHVVAFARAFNAQVTLLRVLTRPPAGCPVDVLDWQLLKAEAQAYLDRIVHHLQTAGVAAESVLVEGQPANCVIDYIHQHAIDLVVLSSHGESGFTGWNIGSVAQKILLRSHVANLLVRAYQPIRRDDGDLRYQRLLVPLDGSLRAECALPAAVTLAHFYQAELWLAHVIRRPDLPHHLPLSGEEQMVIEQLFARNEVAMAQQLQQLSTQWPTVTTTRLLTGEAVAATLDALTATEELDLVILSAHGYSGGSQWPYGSVTTNLIVYGQAPLLLIQDLPAGCPAMAGEIAAQAVGGPVYMAGERLLAH